MVELRGEGQTLTSELAYVRAMARELEAKMDPDKVAAMELCRALASSVDRSIRLAMSCFPPDSQHAGSPRGGDGGGAGNAGRDDATFKKRKGMAKVRRQVRVTSVQDMARLDDGLSWRKYGQKDILGAKYPRSASTSASHPSDDVTHLPLKSMAAAAVVVTFALSVCRAYFRCTHRHTQGCNATKQVQRTDGDPLLFDVVYIGEHTCGQASAAAAAQTAPPLAGAESVQQHAGQEQQRQSSLLAVETEEIIHQGVEPMAPFLFTTTPADVVDSYFPFISPANSDCQFSSDFSAGSVGVDMDHEAPFDDFFFNHPEFFQSEIQNL
ncbi:hypothetical protein E2562_029246 [Oryza meyeriana var. granulata]|uniref:WRKY domain-containing protein n=1 Tax=Oryza meyeriana var. granulata TaxID=110450 RepID=A0A6G1EQU4_9ORYZ|nr:hypothetical protein E2562_029246 [Oryza meyeriana var. granulata]